MKDKTEVILSQPKDLESKPNQIEENLRLIEDLKFFLLTAPANWQKNQIIRRYYLNHDEGFVSCVYWNNLYFITGTDIVRCAVYKFEQFGREIIDRKKFEEGIFSDLRGLKCGVDAVLENSKSPFLEFLYKNSCLRTQKKQKVFFWFSVPHDKIFADALERDLKKEKMDQIGTTKAKSEPSLSFKFDDTTPLYDQLLYYFENQMKEWTTSASSAPTSEEQPQEEQNSADTVDNQLQEQTFYVSENDTSFIHQTPGKNIDDFPLDYFPSDPTPGIQQQQQSSFVIDPAKFFNPPEFYNDELLIDQTYNKTPYYQTSFDSRDETVPVSNLPGVHPLPYIPSYPMTNGQFYDSQLRGSALDAPYLDTSPYPYHPYQAQPMYYYEQQQHQAAPHYQQPIYPVFAENDIDEDDELYNMFQPQPPQYSPQGFPHYQAFAPAAPSLRKKNTNRVSKSLQPKLYEHLKDLKTRISKNVLPIPLNGVSESSELQTESTAACVKDEDDEEYSLPTPESTIPDPLASQQYSTNEIKLESRHNDDPLNSLLEENNHNHQHTKLQ